MKAYVYSLKVYNSAMDFIHNNPQEIIEIHVPDLNFSFNKNHYFQPAVDRYEEALLKDTIILNETQIKVIKTLQVVKSEFQECVIDSLNIL